MEITIEDFSKREIEAYLRRSRKEFEWNAIYPVESGIDFLDDDSDKSCLVKWRRYLRKSNTMQCAFILAKLKISIQMGMPEKEIADILRAEWKKKYHGSDN